jgi:hypothetical protein
MCASLVRCFVCVWRIHRANLDAFAPELTRRGQQSEVKEFRAIQRLVMGMLHAA